ncbi:hypothetical protein [Botrimarina sp.]|uniref:hypothetical protein n=1 Tax=Botrimarina sp. TaxID=2795802 RepID=UPI0032EED1DC
MSVGPVGGILSSAAGSPLSQTKGASEERSAREASERQAADELDLRAQKSSGVGQTDADEQTSDRDADGRRLWERPEEEGQSSDEPAPADTPSSERPDAGDHHIDLLA